MKHCHKNTNEINLKVKNSYEGFVMKKKTYIFNDKTIIILEELKKSTNKKETQIIEEALNHYYDYMRGRSEIFEDLKMISKNFLEIINKVEELSYKLGKCEAKLEFAQKG